MQDVMIITQKNLSGWKREIVESAYADFRFKWVHYSAYWAQEHMEKINLLDYPKD